jgi:hypothetical protein
MIREQIELLRQWAAEDCDEVASIDLEIADTMERMLAVVEAARKMLGVKYKMMGSQEHCDLEAALAALDKDDD